MRIAVVTTSFPHTDEDPSGHFVRSGARALARQGHEVHVVMPGGSMLDPPRRSGGLVLHPAGGGALFGWPGAVARARERPWRLLAAASFTLGATRRLREIGRVDRALAHWIVPSAWPLLSGVEAPLEVVAHGADVRALIAAPAAFRARIVGSLLARGARFTFAAHALRESLVAALGPLASRLRDASRVEPPPIDVPDVSAAAAALRHERLLTPETRLVVCAGRLVASKRVDLVLGAVEACRAPVQLAILGDGPERASLGARALGLKAHVTFTGTLGRREALAWVAAADLLVHASGVEAAPTIVREARALGVRVLACDAGDLAAWAASDAGITLVDARAAAIAHGIDRALLTPAAT
jgi:glycosyltransferase involved in cell wall biosynthesis